MIVLPYYEVLAVSGKITKHVNNLKVGVVRKGVTWSSEIVRISSIVLVVFKNPIIKFWYFLIQLRSEKLGRGP